MKDADEYAATPLGFSRRSPIKTQDCRYPEKREENPATKMPPLSAQQFLLALLTILLVAASDTHAAVHNTLGVNYGQLGSNLPSPAAAVKLLKSVNAARVKIYDANPEILAALSGTKLEVSVMLPNSLIPVGAKNRSFADEWVAQKLAPFRSSVLLRFLLVGNEVLSDYSIKNSTWENIVPAMERFHRSLRTHSLRSMKISTTVAMDALSSSFPPTSGAFRSDLATPIMTPLLRFLHKTGSFFFLDVYPYFPWSQNSAAIGLDYALMEKGAKTYRDPGSGLLYTNLLHQQLEAVFAAIKNSATRT